jgi:hypothetical protein
MGASVKVTDRDNGYKAVTERMRALAKAKASITVGIHADDGSKPHGDGEETVTILQIAIWNEFGTEGPDGEVRVPCRSFIRAWFDAQEPELRKDLEKLMASVVAGKRTSREALEVLGLRMVGQVQQRIADQIPPPNAESTIKAKGSSTPLINFGILRSNILHRVQGAGDE